MITGAGPEQELRHRKSGGEVGLAVPRGLKPSKSHRARSHHVAEFLMAQDTPEDVSMRINVMTPAGVQAASFYPNNLHPPAGHGHVPGAHSGIDHMVT